MIDFGKDVQSLSEFKKNSAEVMDRLRETGDPVVLTINGKARLVIQDAAAYQRLLDEKDAAEALRGIRRGLDDVKHGRTRPARLALEGMRRRRGIPRKP